MLFPLLSSAAQAVPTILPHETEGCYGKTNGMRVQSQSYQLTGKQQNGKGL